MSDEPSNRDVSLIDIEDHSSSVLAIDDVTTNPLVATYQPHPVDTSATSWRYDRDTQPASESGGNNGAAFHSLMPDPPQQAVYFPPPPPPPPLHHPGNLVSSPLEAHDGEFPSISATPIPERHPSTEALADEYEKLRDFGDEVVGLRFRVAAKRKELRDVRFQTSVKDGNVFSLLRQHSLADNTPFPQSILDAMDEASALRDKLGSLETEYDSIEAEYNTLEWSHTDKETKFFEKLVDSGFVANGKFGRRSTSIQHDDAFITKLTSDHLDSLNNTIPAELEQTDDPCGKLIELMGLEKELFDQERLQPREDNLLNSFQSSITSSTERTEERLARARFRSLLFGKMKRVNSWLLDIIEGSPLQKGQLNARLGFNTEDQNDWRHMRESIAQDDKANIPFTNNTLVSSRSVSQDAAATSSNVPHPGDAAAEHDRITSRALESHELYEVGHEAPVNKIDRGTQCNSDGDRTRLNLQSAPSTIGRDSCSSQAQSRRTSYSDGLVTNSDATSGHSCPCKKCTGASPSTMESSSPTTPTQRVRDECDNDTPRQLIDLNGGPQGDASRNSIPPLKLQNGTSQRMTKEKYLEHLTLPPSDFTDELSTTPRHQSTITSSFSKKPLSAHSEPATLSPSPIIEPNTHSSNESAPSNNWSTSTCLAM
ncbi:unnamed protein product [Alternaria burnsii]|nr:unnamed protein product [Alternaria burnsii]